ncbi:hypothetical protein FRC11_013920 [Ceratobasidium sp. 423]|nr:hypothetical protein FRC11_013920 [Ceratobasidium sp. 423]
MSKSKIAMLADVLVHYNSLNHEYCDMALDKSLPRWAQQATNCTQLKLDKYYNLTDTSFMYHLATLLHPSNCEAYMKRLGWKPEWIAEACQIALDTWNEHYKPADYKNGEDDASSQSQFGYSVNEVYSSFAEANDRPVDPVIDFTEGKPILECSKTGRSKPVNPLNWWYAKRLAGEEHEGLTQMALDVLTAPASSIEVEHMFSFSTATLGAYSHADLVPMGILAKAHKKAHKCMQANARAKAANAKVKAVEAEAEVITTEQEQLEDEVMEGGEMEDDEDVLEPSSKVEDIDLEDD